jgi:hypothetical protein
MNCLIIIFLDSQESFTCARAEDAVPCQDAATFYNLNDNFGKIPEDKAAE